MEPPQLRCAQAPMRASFGAPVPMVVDESVGNIWVQECQELGGASRRKRRVHGPGDYSLKLYLSAQSGQDHISYTTRSLHITYTETRNTLYYSASPFTNPKGPDTGRTKVVRGGAWRFSAERCRSGYRYNENPGYADVCFGYDIYGFRCVRKASGGSN